MKIEEVHNNYFTKFKEEEFFHSYDEKLKNIPKVYQEIFKIFKGNIKAVASILLIPQEISSTRTKLYLFDKILTEELIRNTPLVPLSEKEEMRFEEEREVGIKKAAETANKRFFEETYTKEGVKNFWDITFNFLGDCYDSSSDLKIALSELLNQAVVLTWSAFEVLSRDLIKTYLNNNPELVTDILSSSDLKNKFNLKAISIETLSEYSFDISKNMGEIVIMKNDLSNYGILKEMYCSIFSNENISKAAKSSNLYYLNQKRHLFVHKRGIVDKHFLDSTSCKEKKGSKLNVTPQEVLKDLNMTLKIGEIIIEELTKSTNKT